MCNCNNWCNSCKQEIYGVCWLLEWNDIRIEDQTQTWVCCKTYKISSLVDIDSPDGSINVTKTWNTFHLKWFKFDSNTHDRLASVNSADTPGYLTQKIVSTCNNILTITPKQIWIWQWVLDLCIDPSKINVKDEKVAASSWCTSKYLSDILKTNHTDYFQFVKQWCDVSLQVTEKDRFLAHIWTSDMYISWDLPTDVSWYWFIPQEFWSSESTMPAQILDQSFSWVLSWAWDTTKLIKIPYDWWYWIWFGWTGKTSQTVVTIRNQVVIFRWGSELLRVFDDRFSGANYWDSNWDWELSWNDFLNPQWYLMESDNPPGQDWVDSSLSNHISSFWFWAYRLMQLKKDDLVTFIWKVDTGWDNNQFLFWPKVWFTAQGLDLLTNGRGSWVFVTVQEELTKKINK